MGKGTKNRAFLPSMKSNVLAFYKQILFEFFTKKHISSRSFWSLNVYLVECIFFHLKLNI